MAHILHRVTVRELRQNLSVHLRRVERGETLEVTRRGEPVALLAPRTDRLTDVERLVLDFGATRPTGRLEDLPEPLAPPCSKLPSQRLREAREERLDHD
ncbi:MAG: type II toxin-antitoxin system Phd/YefM family antitoxin [Solirubrobacteraceae bacterium]